MRLLNAIFCLGIAITDVKLACGWEIACTYPPENLTALNGRITSPYYPGYYPNNARCDWHIQGPAETGVRLDFSYFYTEEGYDYVTVWEGSNANGNYLGRHSGSGLPPTTLINSSDMYVRFASDGSSVYPGFIAHYNSDPACRVVGRSFLTGQGEISTPYYPDFYPNNEFCTWEITAALGGHIEVQFYNISLEHCEPQCQCDHVEVYDGSSLVGRWCGLNNPGYIVSSTNNLTVRFGSNNIVKHHNGFKMHYVTTDPEIRPMLPPSIDIPMNGTARVVGGTPLTPECLLAYNNEFTASSRDAVTMANTELQNGNLCGESAGIHVLWEDSRVFVDQSDPLLLHLTMFAAVPGQSEYTVNNMEVCATAVLNFLLDLNNWTQPVLPNIDNCPEVVIDPYSLVDDGMAWCHPIHDLNPDEYDDHLPPCKRRPDIQDKLMAAAAVAERNAGQPADGKQSEELLKKHFLSDTTEKGGQCEKKP